MLLDIEKADAKSLSIKLIRRLLLKSRLFFHIYRQKFMKNGWKCDPWFLYTKDVTVIVFRDKIALEFWQL